MNGQRYMYVVDGGWIFAGDESRTEDGYLHLSRAVHVFRWREIGFARMVSEWRDERVDVRPCTDVEIPQNTVLFRVPVPSDWGLR